MVRKYVVSARGGRGTHPDIQSALRAAAARGRAARIEIAPGRYEEQLTVHGEVELVAAGEPGSVVLGRPRGTVLTTLGSVVVRGLVLTGRDADAGVVHCRAGFLTLDRVEVRAHHGVCVHVPTGTCATLTDSGFRFGRTVFAGSTGVVERCRFAGAADNAIAVIESARVTVRDSRVDGAAIHGVRVSDAWAHLTGCEITGTERTAVIADAQAELTVEDCRIEGVHAAALEFVERSRGAVRGTRVLDAENGIVVASGADPQVRGCVFTGCRDTGIHVQDAGLGAFEDCEVVDAGNVAVLSTRGGAPRVDGCRVSGGNVGIAVTDRARGRFTGCQVRDLTGVGLRVWDESKAVFEDVRVERCPFGLDAKGNGGTTAELTGVSFGDFDMIAVAAVGQSRVTLRGATAERGLLGFGAGEEAQLHLHDCTVTGVETGGALAFGTARLVARNLTVTGAQSYGLCGTGSAYLDVTGGSFEDCAATGLRCDGECGGRLVDCSVTGTSGTAVQHNGRVQLVSLRTTLPVKEITEPAPPPTIVNNYHGPVFVEAVHSAQLAWGNTNVVQQQTHQSRPDDRSERTGQTARTDDAGRGDPADRP
ncbi:right-handed parallel beta-helix repeat-containing protein [Streptomyces sp. ID05-04B]|uniref:right-handed parallel beta-helix repeat-containing protein n=1 Tax=unclassified Streptomyces TaxID=2593676 RepID=UPI000D19961D|nr:MULTISPECIES: right-handed parallel beta-helix repeat-containing protein [unclassified Streptomyces]AVV45530.1 stage V sporulation protein K [Streptomyces sp. P3]MDX5568675.1 right-handed parallel beta-helix repeat-containing protein [Streptomyces sp. ID05-04B]